uniref:Uncharacterized protein n=1 Tax=Arundo donax TaxID=35708 RepID=A0A0A9DXI1_ARUDO
MSSTEPNLLSVLLSISSFLCKMIQVRYMHLHGRYTILDQIVGNE